MKSRTSTRTKHIAGTARTVAGALLAASVVIACDAQQPDSLSDGSAGTDTADTRAQSPNPRQVNDPARGSKGDPASRAGTDADNNKAVSQFAMIESAVADIESADNQTAAGSVEFKPGPDAAAMQVIVRLQGLEPGPHGIHIHDSDQCWEDGEFVAGSHFNPFDTAHGGPDDDEHHVGDMGNVVADADGNVRADLELDYLAFSGPESILQRVVVVHSGEDDLSSQPSGDAGSPVACGIIFQQREVLAEPIGEQ